MIKRNFKIGALFYKLHSYILLLLIYIFIEYKVELVNLNIFKVSSPFYLSLNEGSSEVGIFSGDTIGMYFPLLHIPSKPIAGYCGLSEVLKFKGKF